MYSIRRDVPAAEFLDKAEEALEGHYKQVANNQDLIKLAPDLEKYEQLQSLGILRNVVVEVAGKIVGYSVLLSQPHLHYKHDVFSMVDVIYVAPEYRSSRLGLLLVKETEELAEEEGASVLTYHTKPAHPAIEKLLYRKGYSHMENIIGKRMK